MLRLPVSHHAADASSRQGAKTLPVSWGCGVAGAQGMRAGCVGATVDTYYIQKANLQDCAALQGLRDDMLALFQDVLSMQVHFMWEETRVQMSKDIFLSIHCEGSLLRMTCDIYSAIPPGTDVTSPSAHVQIIISPTSIVCQRFSVLVSIHHRAGHSGRAQSQTFQNMLTHIRLHAMS